MTLYPGVETLPENPASLVEVSRADSFHDGGFQILHFLLEVICSPQRNIEFFC